MEKIFHKCLALSLMLLLCGCATKYETDTLTVFVDKASLEDTPAEEITSGSIDMKQMKSDKKLNIGIRLSFQDESQGRAKLPNQDQFVNDAYKYAQNYLGRVKAYRVVVLPPETNENDLKTGKDFDGVKYHFLIDMHITLNSEIEQRFDYDEAMYKTSIEWKLIDNRTRSNGLGDNEAPFIKESLTCKNVTSRKIAISHMARRRMAGSEVKNAMNAYKVTLENALIEFRAQLANRIPFGGKITRMRERDGNVLFTLKAGEKDGVTKRMQMLVMNADGDHVAIATATGAAKETESTLRVWRWLSPSLEDTIKEIAGNKKKAAAYFDDEDEDNSLYAICLGMPTPSKDERTQIRDFE
ncbi:MAG: hypothetical protein IKA22_09890 [Lentisphaeria bacterium]|nr:hypothetical protein [Lentisphaeria bacterium]